MRGLISSTATRSPSIDTSSSSPRTVLPNSWPVGIECSCMRKLYSPSAGNVCITDDAAARAERRAFDVLHLRAGARHLVGGFGGAGLRVADRERADAARGAQVAFHQRRREVLRVGDVVEAGADRVGRQERVTSTSRSNMPAHRARVLGAVQALERTTAGIGIERGRLIEPRFHRGGKRRQHRALGTPRRPTAASCPRAACGSSSPPSRQPAASWPTFAASKPCSDSPPALFLLRSL